MLINFIWPEFTSVRNKLECLSLAGPFQPSQMFASERCFTRVSSSLTRTLQSKEERLAKENTYLITNIGKLRP